jgi:hypothetical protein
LNFIIKNKAIAAISVISDRICIASEGKVKSGISAQQLVECCDYCGGLGFFDVPFGLLGRVKGTSIYIIL